jgi:hypothetical protein
MATNDKLNSYVFTFGTGQLKNFNVSNPNAIALLIIAKTESEARQIVFDDPDIGSAFCTSYPLDTFNEQFEIYRIELLDLDMLKKRKTDA